MIVEKTERFCNLRTYKLICHWNFFWCIWVDMYMTYISVTLIRDCKLVKNFFLSMNHLKCTMSQKICNFFMCTCQHVECIQRLKFSHLVKVCIFFLFLFLWRIFWYRKKICVADTYAPYMSAAIVFWEHKFPHCK